MGGLVAEAGKALEQRRQIAARSIRGHDTARNEAARQAAQRLMQDLGGLTVRQALEALYLAGEWIVDGAPVSRPDQDA